MNKRTRLSIAVSALGLSLAIVASGSAASLDTPPSGGWSESEGYFSNSSDDGFFQIAAVTSSPKSHRGERRVRHDSDGSTGYAAYGETIWKDKSHYTTAQIRDNRGTIRTNSGRKWGTGYTEAHSGTDDRWYYPGAWENIEARTFWGS